MPIINIQFSVGQKVWFLYQNDAGNFSCENGTIEAISIDHSLRADQTTLESVFYFIKHETLGTVKIAEDNIGATAAEALDILLTKIDTDVCT